MTELVQIAPGHYLAPAPAASYARARAAGMPAGITSSYRDPVRQAAMRAEYDVELAAYRAGRGDKPTFVAKVEDSEHVTGNALDLPLAPRLWMREHPEHGFVFTDKSEAWHVAYRLDRDRLRLSAPDPITPAAPAAEQKDDDMATVFAGPSGRAVGSPGFWRVIANDGELERAIRAHGQPVPVADAAEMASYREFYLSFEVSRNFAKAVWDTTVQRGASLIKALQEVADSKTIGERVEAIVKRIEAKL